jgi:hypothetical protein
MKTNADKWSTQEGGSQGEYQVKCLLYRHCNVTIPKYPPSNIDTTSTGSSEGDQSYKALLQVLYEIICD